MRRRAWVWTNVTVVAGLGVLAAAAFLARPLAERSAAPEPDSPGEIQLANDSNAIPRSYVVVLKRGQVPARQVAPTANTLASKFSGKVGFTFASAGRGFSVTMDPEQARKLAKDPAVAYVQQNRTVRASGTQNNPPSWGLDRIDQRALPTDKVYQYPVTGSGVTAYVIDTGIRISHSDFGGRASHGYDFVDNDPDATDCEGHGTHVAGTVGGTTYGVAKEVKLVGVRVLGCDGSGTTASVIAGINWVTENAVRPAVANMSLGGGADPALDEAVADSIAAGIPYAVAGGNDNVDACEQSPARVPDALTVGATADTDARASFSNYGKCLDIFAPGQAITSAGIADDKASESLSGTSMAAPHVAGAAALVLAANPSYDPKQVSEALIRNATGNRVTGPGTASPNRLLYTGSQPDTGAPCAGRPSGSASAGPGGGVPGGPGGPGGPMPGGPMPGVSMPGIPAPGGGQPGATPSGSCAPSGR
jgi:subtilisin family serine protease